MHVILFQIIYRNYCVRYLPRRNYFLFVYKLGFFPNIKKLLSSYFSSVTREERLIPVNVYICNKIKLLVMW